jgi:TM2 domain-containing membrane protein YozV
MEMVNVNNRIADQPCEKGPEEIREKSTWGRDSPDGKPSQESSIESVSSSPEELQNPFVAALCSMCCFGLGQFHNGRTGDGILVWLFVLVPVALAFMFPAFFDFFLFMGIGAWMYSVFDAYSVARKINAGEIEFNGISELFFFPVLVLVSMGCAFSAYWLINALI